jgi:hypothetical protein
LNVMLRQASSMHLPRKRWRRIAPEVRANCKARVTRMSHRVARIARPIRDIRDLCSMGYRSRVSLRLPGLRKGLPTVVHELVNVYLSPLPKPRLSCSRPAGGERFLEASPNRTERELAGPGRPGTVDRLVAKGGAPGGAAPYVTGRARFTLPREVGTLIPPLRVPAGTLAPPAAPSLAPFARNLQTSDALRRENERVWLFEI